jgi:hypothetical protein
VLDCCGVPLARDDQVADPPTGERFVGCAPAEAAVGVERAHLDPGPLGRQAGEPRDGMRAEAGVRRVAQRGSCSRSPSSASPIETYLRLMYLKHRYGLGDASDRS